MHPGEEAGLIPREYDGDTQSPDFEWNNDDDSSNNNNNHPPPIRPWARLVAVERSNPDIELLEDDTIVGRGADPNGNRKVSKFHCRIYKDSSGHISVSNLSRNGTLVNGSLLENDKCRTFLHGDEIVLGPLTSGIPQYIFHILNKGSQGAIIDRKRSSELLDIDTQLESTKRLKLSKVKDDFKCCICLSIWHDVVSVAPCLHNFCNGCFSEWYKNDKLSRCKCPQCREPVVFVKRNHTLSNIIEDYLQEFPSLKRSAEEIARLDHIAIVRNNFVKIGSGGGYESSTSEDDEDEEWDLEHCPQCPRPNVLADGAFHCGPQTLHLACTACNALMPERSDTNVPQKCVGCFQVFCGLYWCSQNISRPNGVLINCTKKKMSERTITEIPDGTFQGNVYERDVTKRYIQEQRLQIQNVVHEWLGKMDRGETDKPELPGSRQTSFTSESYFCNQCANTIVQHLLYKFRLSLPKNELPPEAAGREDCWYGRLCRTQVHKDSHARKYNHACEPSSRTRHS